jgi:hypothetical protein
MTGCIFFVIDGMINDHIQVIGSAAVIKAQLPVHLFTASAIIPGQHIVAILKNTFAMPLI